MEGIKRLIVEEPVMTQGLVQAAIAMLVGFGLNWSADQVALVLAFTATLLAVAARAMVTPMAHVDEQVEQGVRRVVRQHADRMLQSLTPEEAASLAQLRADRDRLAADVAARERN